MSFRDHRPYHERNLDQQILDALLRIEEILAALRDAGANGPPATFAATAPLFEGAVTAMPPANKGKRK